jgi:hypothetical protein
MTRFLLLAGAGLLIALPAGARSGPATTSGDQSLRAAASLSAKALHLGFVYTSLNQDAGIKESPRTTTLSLPPALTLRLSQRPACRLSTLRDAKAGGRRYAAEACPKHSILGIGTITLDTRPPPCAGDCVVPLCARISPVVGAGVEVVNGLDDLRVDGSPRQHPVRAVLVAGHTARQILAFDQEGSRLVMHSAPMGYCFFNHVHRLDFSLNRGAYLTAPRACGALSFAVSIVNHDGPAIAARDRVRCRG